MSEDGTYVYAKVEAIRVEYQTGRINRGEAIRRIHEVADVTPVGAANILDHPKAPTERLERA